MAELKPCPFCGHVATLLSYDLFNDSDDLRYRVVCSFIEGGCGATNGFHDTEAEAIKAWNRRAGDGNGD